MKVEGAPKGASEDLRREICRDRSTGDPHDALMADLGWAIKWLDRHEHWWMRQERWRREGRAA